MSDALVALQQRHALAQLVANADAYAWARQDHVVAYQEKCFLAGSGRLVLSVSGNVRGRIINPAGSGVNILVVDIAGFSTAAGWAELRLNPATGLPGGSRTPLNIRRLTSDALPVATVAVDTSATTPLAGGTPTSVMLGIPAGRRFREPVMIELEPGEALGLNVPFAGAADMEMGVRWKVVPR